jgi:hypothetical protein
MGTYGENKEKTKGSEITRPPYPFNSELKNSECHSQMAFISLLLYDRSSCSMENVMPTNPVKTAPQQKEMETYVSHTIS